MKGSSASSKSAWVFVVSIQAGQPARQVTRRLKYCLCWKIRLRFRFERAKLVLRRRVPSTCQGVSEAWMKRVRSGRAS